MSGPLRLAAAALRCCCCLNFPQLHSLIHNTTITTPPSQLHHNTSLDSIATPTTTPTRTAMASPEHSRPTLFLLTSRRVSPSWLHLLRRVQERQGQHRQALRAPLLSVHHLGGLEAAFPQQLVQCCRRHPAGKVHYLELFDDSDFAANSRLAFTVDYNSVADANDAALHTSPVSSLALPNGTAEPIKSQSRGRCLAPSGTKWRGVTSFQKTAEAWHAPRIKKTPEAWHAARTKKKPGAGRANPVQKLAGGALTSFKKRPRQEKSRAKKLTSPHLTTEGFMGRRIRRP